MEVIREADANADIVIACVHWGTEYSTVLEKVQLTTGKEYLYLGFQTEIKRMPIGSETVENFYKLQENEAVFALASDQKDQIYLSLREYNEETNTYKNRLVKIDSKGKVLVEYDLENTLYKQDKTAGDMLADKMLTDVSIPAFFEPAVRTLRATLPVLRARIPVVENHHSGLRES